MSNFKDKVAIITGGSGGIGSTCAKMLLEKGAKVLLVDLNEDALKQTVDDLGGDQVSCCVADVSKDSDVKNYVQTAIEHYGRIDHLFNNAGVEGVVKPLTEYPEDTFDQVMNVNVKGVWLAMKHAFPEMAKTGGGSVVITSSVAGLQGTAMMMAYTASKHAAIGVMKVAALEGAEMGIRVNSIHPAPIDNRMMRSLEEGFAPGAGSEVKKQFEQMIPLKRYGTNEDVAKLATFLLSEDSSFITGAQYRVDGGMGA